MSANAAAWPLALPAPGTSVLRGLPAPAKINTFLHVVGRRADGMHRLQSVFVLIDWADTLHLARRSDGQLTRRDLTAALPADDLTLRAARALQAASGTHWGVDIEIAKSLPWGAGLGGGSSDAATVLLALNHLWQLHWPRARLAQLALTLGADVPFFVGGASAFVEGVGEVLHPLPPALVAGQWLAVVKPPAALATAEVFADPALPRSTKEVIVAGFLADASHAAACAAQGECDHAAFWAFGHNDLQRVAERLAPEVAEVARWLTAQFGNSRMSGSGSAVFSVVPARSGTGSQPVATWPQGGLPGSAPQGWVGRLCRSLPSHPLVHWAS